MPCNLKSLMLYVRNTRHFCKRCQTTSIVIDHLNAFYHLIQQHVFRVDIFIFISPKKKRRCSEKSNYLLKCTQPSASDGTLLYPAWVSVFLDYDPNFPTAAPSGFQNVSNSFTLTLYLRIICSLGCWGLI